MRILGLDPGLVATGWGVIDCDGARLSHVGHGVVATDPREALPRRLARLCAGLRDAIAAHAPDEAAIEEVFLNANPRSSLKLGEARGVVLLAVGEARLPVTEIAARAVKKALVGTGAAEKAQVAAMVGRLLPAAGQVSADAADALAVAIAAASLRRMARAVARA
ncbi:crossover junction endodeoxyribonuclease RuvC [Thermaurantiacus sp.]